MSDDRNFERNARSWLELGPTDAPDRVIADALSAIETTPQERDYWLPWKDLRMTIPLRLATAAVIGVLAIGSGLLLLKGPLAQVGSPSPTPVPTIQLAEGPPWLVFQSLGAPNSTTDPGPLQLWAVKVDGSGLHALANGVETRGAFDISPDGTTVAFTGAKSQVWTAPIEGGSATLVSTDCGGFGSSCWDSDPGYSPDGTLLAFGRGESKPGGNGGEWVVGVRDLTTGSVRLLEATRYAGNFIDPPSTPTWSPDASQIAFGRAADGVHSKGSGFIVIAQVDGAPGHELPLPSGARIAGRPDWSPDGSLILFSTSAAEIFDYAPFPTLPRIYTIRPDGSDLTVVCPRCDDNDRFASWTHDGRILFWAGSSWDLMDADGANRAHLNWDALWYRGTRLGLGSRALLQATR